ncbi:MAG: ABC transporter permease [Proteobacteria bacterium]|nr:ABC transporter permease [Pseudomonadota bacterium]MCP4918482.1 ABC transporter permease [Pseudomonadota bacterium]
MQTVLAIYRRELASSFNSPLAYIVVPVYLGLVGLFALFLNDIFASGLATLRVVFFWCAMFLLLLVPAVTMRLFAEEKRTGSLELLVTLPVTEGQVVAGKFGAALTLILVAVGLTIPYPIVLAQLGDLDWGPVIGGYIGLGLLAAAYTAIGTAASSLTSNQIVAFLVAVSLCIVPYVVGFFLQAVPPSILPIVQYMSFDYHFSGMSRGVIDTRNLVFTLSIVALFLHVAVFALEQRRLS